jgi:hypothetical protein
MLHSFNARWLRCMVKLIQFLLPNKRTSPSTRLMLINPPALAIIDTGKLLRGVILASYISGTPARSAAALSEEEHVALIQRTMVEVQSDSKQANTVPAAQQAD